MNIAAGEKISAYTHGGTVPVMVIGTIFLLVMSSGDIVTQAVSLVYGASGVFLFSASFLYHAKKQTENNSSLWRKLDHTAIFFLIAGTYTPLCFLYLDGQMRWSILIAQWSLVFCGTIFKLIFINAPRIIGTLVYLLMGWIVVIPLTTLVDKMPIMIFSLLVGGGVSYSTGAIIYAIKKPNPRPGIFGFHEIFHILVSGGAVLHLLMVVFGVRGYLYS